MSATTAYRRFAAMLRGASGQPPQAGSQALAASEARIVALLQAERASAAEREQQHFEELVKNQIRVQWRLLDGVAAAVPPPASLHCDICGFAGGASVFRVLESQCMFGGGRLVRHECPACDSIFGPHKMMALKPEELSQEYEMHYRVYPEGDSTPEEIRAFHALAPDRGKRYLNFGAGAWSRSVDELRAQGWEVYAYEPHAAATRGEHVIRSEAHLTSISFDGIFSNNVLEHFRDPVAELRKMRTLLRPGGRMSHATPCFAYLYEFTRFHLFFFPGRSLSALAAAAGLHVDEFTVDGQFMNAVLSTGTPGQAQA
jgi:SAM-dependent methyltransferase